VAVTPLGAGAQLASKFDLTLYAAETPEGLALHLVYNADLFDAERMRALLAQFASVLAQAAADPERPVPALALRTDDAALPDEARLLVRTPAGVPAGVGELGALWSRAAGGALRPAGGHGRYRPDGSLEIVAPPAISATRPAPSPAAGEDAAVASPSELQATVAEIWAEVLGMDPARIGAAADFFALGGHSLQATQVLSRIRARLGVRLHIRAFFAAPTVAALACAVREAGGADRAPRARDGEPAPADLPPGVYPLSFAQQRLWVLGELGAASAYNLPAALRLKGPLDTWALERALDEIVRRHEPLRTRIEVHDGEPLQVVQPPRPLRLPVEALPAGVEDGVEGAMSRAAADEADRPFPAGGPYFRARLFRAGAQDHLLTWILHHLVGDGWSAGVFRGELAALYAAFTRGEPSPLPPLPATYGTHALRQRKELLGPDLAQLERYWRDRLAGAPALLDLPLDRPRPAEPDSRGATLAFVLPPGAVRAVDALGRTDGATPFMVLLAAFAVVLARASGQDDVVVGTAIANRTRPEVEPLIGFFANTLALRTQLDGDLSFRALLGRVRETLLGAYEHQDLPFERLVELVQPPRTLAHTPIFQVMFLLQDAGAAAGGDAATAGDAWNAMQVSPVGRERRQARFDLSLSLQRQGASLVGAADYRTSLFDAPTIERLVARMGRVLASVADEPDARVSEIDLLSDEERLALAAWNRTERDVSARTALALFDGWVARTPDAPALAFEGERLTFAELDARTRRIARGLVARGAGPEARVGLCVERSAEMIVALLGILRAGAAYVPLDPTFPPARMADMLADAGASLVLAQDALLPVLQGIGAEVVRIGEIERNAPDAVPLPEIRPESLAYVIYTSGSTGRPKGVAVEHRQLAHYAQAVAERLALPERASYATVSTIAADLGHTSVFGALCGGGCLHVIGGERIGDAQSFAAYLADNAVDVLKITPSHLAALMGGADPGAVLPRRCLVLGGEASRATWVDEIRALAPELRLVNHYGPTETTVGALAYVADSELPDTSGGTVPIGRPLANARAYVLDAALRPVPIGIPGELCIGGLGVARGYLGRAALTAERFVPDPFADVPGARMYRTGDRARRLAEGSIEFLGRIDQQVKVRGFRVEPGEVESILRAHTAVRDAAVVARPDPNGTAVLLAYVVGAQGAAADGDALHRHCAAHLPAYMVPAVFVPLDALPLTPNGKLDRAALPAPEGTPGDGYVVPRDVTELQVARIWSEALGVPRIGANDDFFRLGGHSLLAVRMLPRIRERFGRDLPLTTLFQHSTVAAFAAALRREGADADDGRLLVTLNAGGARPPLFFFPPAGGTVTHYADLARLMGPDQPFLAFQAPGVNGAEAPLTTVESMVDRYLAEIRQAQPQGPYWLGGWSAGGLTAFETARRLRAEGEEVALLALVDPPAPDAEREAAPDQVALYRRFARSTVTGDEALLDALADELRALAPEERLAGLSRWITRHGGHVMDAELERVGRVMAVYEATARAVRDYRDPPPLDAPAVLFVATEGRPEDGFGPDVLPGRWRPFVAGELPVRLIPGVHAQLVLEPAAVALADALREAMEARRQRSDPKPMG
jgi:amino acid adenylation domain-containing protein